MAEVAFPVAVAQAWTTELAALDSAWQGGDAATPVVVQASLAEWRIRLDRLQTTSEEMLDVVDAAGGPRGWTAPRWFCHLTGLRHRVVHLFLTSPQGHLVLQMRAADKAEWPQHFDTTVGGHLKAGQDWYEGTLGEIGEELGLATAAVEKWLVGGRLYLVGPVYERHGVSRDLPPIRNRQVNQTFAGELTEWGLAHLHFADGEVAGVYLCPPAEVQRMIANDFLVAPGLRHAFPRWWDWRFPPDLRETPST